MKRTKGRLKASRARLVEALHCRVTAHHRFMLELHLTQIEALEAAIAKLERHMGGGDGPFSQRGVAVDGDAGPE